MKNDQWQFVVRTSDFYLSLFICHFAIGHLSSVTLPASSVLCVSDTGHAGCVRSQGHGEKSFPASEGFAASTERQGFSVFPKSRVRAADRAFPGRRASACYYQTRYLQQGPLAEIHAMHTIWHDMFALGIP